MMLVRYSGVKKHIPKGMLAKNDSQEKMWGLSSVLNKGSAICTMDCSTWKGSNISIDFLCTNLIDSK